MLHRPSPLSPKAVISLKEINPKTLERKARTWAPLCWRGPGYQMPTRVACTITSALARLGGRSQSNKYQVSKEIPLEFMLFYLEALLLMEKMPIPENVLFGRYFTTEAGFQHVRTYIKGEYHS